MLEKPARVARFWKYPTEKKSYLSYQGSHQSNSPKTHERALSDYCWCTNHIKAYVGPSAVCATCMDSLIFYRHTLPMVAANVNLVVKATAYYRPSTRLHFRVNNIRIILILISGYATPPFTHPLRSLNKSAKDLVKTNCDYHKQYGHKQNKNTWR